MFIKNAIGHFKTITAHKMLVMKYCFRLGLYKQGLLHDMSKYSWYEFKTGIKYYRGDKSPNGVERIKTGVSMAWLHHKGRNKHHYEYWIDYDLEKHGNMIGMRMPYRYVAEMFCDRLAACKIYRAKEYNDSCPFDYFYPSKDSKFIHEKTSKELLFLLMMLKEKGEDYTFTYLKKEIKRRRKSKDFF